MSKKNCNSYETFKSTGKMKLFSPVTIENCSRWKTDDCEMPKIILVSGFCPLKTEIARFPPIGLIFVDR